MEWIRSGTPQEGEKLREFAESCYGTADETPDFVKILPKVYKEALRHGWKDQKLRRTAALRRQCRELRPGRLAPTEDRARRRDRIRHRAMAVSDKPEEAPLAAWEVFQAREASSVESSEKAAIPVP